MPSCAAACSDYSHAARVAARLNARFFNASGVGLEQGLLIHGLDHQTSGTKKQWWLPHGDRLSASYVRASMARDPGGALPLFRDWSGLDPPGLILRPDATEIRCAFTQDVGTDFAAKEECSRSQRWLRRRKHPVLKARAAAEGA